MSDTNRKWFYLLTLSLIWGSSYILIKKGLVGFSPLQLGSLRIVIACLMLIIIGLPSLKSISGAAWKWVILSGWIGSLIPMYLFAFAETEIDSSVASVLNSLVPLFTIFVGFFAFGIHFSRNQLIGVLVGLGGASLLILMGADANPEQNYWFAGLVVLATVCYACNANIIKAKLSEVSPMGIATGNFIAIVIPALILVFVSGALEGRVRNSPEFLPSLGYVILLCFFGTCVAKVMFNKLVHISSPVFSVSVTYLIPIVGIAWGILDGETISLGQSMGAGLILVGVYLVNRVRKS